MMKNIVSLLFSVLSVLCLSQIPKDMGDLEYNNLIGNIKSVKEITYKYTDSADSKKPMLQSTRTTHYNKKKNKTLLIINDANNELKEKQTFTYDANGNLISKTEYNKNEDGETNMTYHYKYNDKQLLSEEVGYDSTGALITKTLITYPDNDHEAESKTYDSKGNLTSKSTVFFSAMKGIPSKIIEYTPTDSLEAVYTFKYDGDLCTSLKISSPATETKLLEIAIKYNDKKLPSEVSIEWPFGPIKANFKYLSFDKKGNWTRRETYTNEELSETSEQIIEYY
ncbi:RHS repeat protein [Bergeyella cardium]|uniref:Uncharacterized protein n=1 Tax=Bergeyella cardium TaxID=1585976 RepID=A0A6P1QYS9_9FLAO|nr:RHS repeat protein [Bergeyella cardium]QHN66061.1 hypothetical protein DBX24_09290 [Bergeyella cardium]WHE33666.1 RHS repeat protein [Bergeyella cardium]WHF60316.1 RHS repeat protein [Bergeyella cardium]